MSNEYSALITALTATGIPFAEYAWANAPAAGSYGVYALEFDADTVWGDNLQEERAKQGSIDLYSRGNGDSDAALIEAALASCEVSWRLSYKGFESGRRLVHREWVFEVV